MTSPGFVADFETKSQRVRITGAMYRLAQQLYGPGHPTTLLRSLRYQAALRAFREVPRG